MSKILSTIESYKNIILAGMGIALALFIVFIFYQNQRLKAEVKRQEVVIISQQESLVLWQEKQAISLQAIEDKEKEITRLEQERVKNESEFNKKASKEYHQWRNVVLPDDISKRLQ